MYVHNSQRYKNFIQSESVRAYNCRNKPPPSPLPPVTSNIPILEPRPPSMGRPNSTISGRPNVALLTPAPKGTIISDDDGVQVTRAPENKWFFIAIECMHLLLLPGHHTHQQRFLYYGHERIKNGKLNMYFIDNR